MNTTNLIRRILTPVLLGAVASSLWAAEKKPQPGPQRPSLTEEQRMKHIPPLPPADKPLAGLRSSELDQVDYRQVHLS